MSPGWLALRFLSGPHQGAVVALDPASALVVGRRGAADLGLDDELVSRRHARLAFVNGVLTIEDLASANGTWLNGARVTRARVGEGDRLLVGATLVKVVPAAQAREEGRPFAAVAGARKAGQVLQTGRLEEVPVAVLLRQLAAGGMSVLVAVEHEGRLAEAKLEGGRLVACAIDGRTEVGTRKSLARLVASDQGRFTVRELPAGARSGASGEPVEPLVTAALRDLSELRAGLRTLPPRLALRLAPGDLERLDPDDRALLVLASQREKTQEVLDLTTLSDLEASRRLRALLDRGLLVGR